MKLTEVSLQKFRGYKSEVIIPFENLTVLIGRNDAGKSSILDALNIKEMSPELAKTLSPQMKNKNWDSLFSVTLSGDDGISINKRGSGTRRLVLSNFFRAKAEDAAHTRGTGTIYAIEEPETSQHPNHQLTLLNPFQELTEETSVPAWSTRQIESGGLSR
ncbi:MAG: AAA family ATPase [Verrucomicrobia bacterium]|nr:AAA family ATPase [Verrucomicrobiota bacterium]